MDYATECAIDNTLATLKSAVNEEVAIRAAINRKRSRVVEDINALSEQLRRIDIHCVESPEAASIRATIDRLWHFVLILDEALGDSFDRESKICRQQASILRRGKGRKHN